MRPDFVFSDSSVSPSFFFTTPAKKPRTECGCQPVARTIAAIVAPPRARSMLRTRSCLVFPLLKAVRFHFLLGALAGFERELGFGLDFATRTSEVSDTIVAPPRPRQGQLPAGFGPEAHARSFRHRQQRSVRSRSPARPEQSCCSLAAMSAIVKPAIQPSFLTHGQLWRRSTAMLWAALC